MPAEPHPSCQAIPLSPTNHATKTAKHGLMLHPYILTPGPQDHQLTLPLVVHTIMECLLHIFTPQVHSLSSVTFLLHTTGISLDSAMYFAYGVRRVLKYFKMI